MFTRVTIAKTARMEITTTTTTVWTRATAWLPTMLRRVMTATIATREELGPPRVAVGDGAARVAAERDGDHARDDRVRGQDEPGDDAGEVAVAPTSHDVFEQAARRRVPRAQLGEGIALQSGDRARDQERQPDRGARDLTGRAEQREDPRADHRADADERGLAHRQVRGRGRRLDGRHGYPRVATSTALIVCSRFSA